MADHAKKKRMKRIEVYSIYYLAAVGIMTALFVLKLILQRGKVGWGYYFGSLFLYMNYTVAFWSIKNSLAVGASYWYMLDYFIVSVCTQFITFFTVYGWLLLLTIPAYGVYKLICMYLTWVFTPDQEPSQDPAMLKKAQKAERKMKRAKLMGYS